MSEKTRKSEDLDKQDQTQQPNPSDLDETKTGGEKAEDTSSPSPAEPNDKGEADADVAYPETSDLPDQEEGQTTTFDVIIEEESTEVDEPNQDDEDFLLPQINDSVLVPGGYPVLSLKHVGYRKKIQGKSQQILDDINLDFRLRRIYSVITRVPAKQAALMAVMTGLRVPTSGSVLFRGTDLRQLLASDYRGHQIGAIFGKDALRMDLTAVENLVYTMSASGRTFMGPKQSLAQNLLDRVGFPETLLDKPVSELNKLDYRLASVARALSCECDVLIADEPTDGLEPGDWDSLLSVLKKVSRRNDCAVIIITSDNLDTTDESTYDDRFIVD